MNEWKLIEFDLSVYFQAIRGITLSTFYFNESNSIQCTFIHNNS